MAAWSVCWMVAALACVTKVSPQTLELTAQSLGSPDYYINDTLIFNCTSSGYNWILVRQRYYTSIGSYDIGCDFNSDGWNIFPGSTSGLNPSLDFCNGLDRSGRSGITLVADVKITRALAGVQIGCFTEKPVADVLDFKNLTISTSLKVAPEGLTFVKTDQERPVVEGEAFGFQCITTSASDSDYRYDLKRDGASIRELEGGTYTPSEEDRAGFRIMCTDTVHVNWRGGNTKEESEILTPLYFAIEGNEELQRSISLNPTSPLPLTCNVIGNPSPAFSWESESSRLTETSNSLNLNPAKAANGDVETVSCTAAVDGIPNITITWSVTWDDDATSIAPGTGATITPVAILALVTVFIV